MKKVAGVDTSDEGSMVEVILEDKTPQQAPQHAPDNSEAPVRGELKKDTLSTYHHPHLPARKQPTRLQQISHKDNKPRRTYKEERRSTYYTSTQKR